MAKRSASLAAISKSNNDTTKTAISKRKRPDNNRQKDMEIKGDSDFFFFHKP